MAPKRSVQAVTIALDGTHTVFDLDRAGELRTLQGIVGGWIEGLSSADGKVTFFCNEEGKLQGLARNETATRLWWALNPAMAGYDSLCGAVVVTGGADASGAATDVPQHVITALTPPSTA